MKRIKVKEIIRGYVIAGQTLKIIKFIGNNYRRRQYKRKGYSCNSCGKIHKVNSICKQPIKRGN